MVFLLSLAGFPPTGGFIGKLYLLMAAVDAGHVSLAVVLVLTSFVSYYYYLRVIWKMYFEEAPEDAAMPAPAGAAFRLAADGAALVILVVLHHVAGVYAANIPWYYYIDPQYADLLAIVVLMAFMLLNQAVGGNFGGCWSERSGVAAQVRRAGAERARSGFPVSSQVEAEAVFPCDPGNPAFWKPLPAVATGLVPPRQQERCCRRPES